MADDLKDRRGEYPMITKIIFIPLYIIVLIIRIILDVILRLSAWIFYTVAGLLLIVTVFCYCMQLESPAGIRQMLIGCGTILVLPQAATIFSALVEFTAEVLRERIRGI